MVTTDFMEEKEVFELLGKKKTAVWRLRKEHGFPQPVLTYPTRYSRKAVTRWLDEGELISLHKLVQNITVNYFFDPQAFLATLGCH